MNVLCVFFFQNKFKYITPISVGSAFRRLSLLTSGLYKKIIFAVLFEALFCRYDITLQYQGYNDLLP